MTTVVTPAIFRGNFTEFGSVSAFPDPVVQFWLDAADLMLSVTRWGRARDLGLQLFAAHNLTLEKQAMNAAAKGGVPGQATGPVSAKAVGPGSVAYDTAASAAKDAGHWNTTTYGQRLWTMMQMFGAGPIQVGIGCPPVGVGSPFFNGGAWPGPAPWPLPSGTGFSS